MTGFAPAAVIRLTPALAAVRELEFRLLMRQHNKGTKLFYHHKAASATKSVAKSAGGIKTNVSPLTEAQK